jgi:nicotinate phosphoribosyltransferase
MASETDGRGLALFTDLYELTMLQAYLEEGMTDAAVFSLFVRRLPENRNFLLACGIPTVLDYLEQLRFTSDDLAYLDSSRRFSSPFLNWLRGFRFTGDVYAVAEGTPVFANEPLMQIVAPIAEAQVVETLVMNQIHLQTVLASKAVRVVAAARGRKVVDFGARRMHGVDAALKAARAFYVAGVAATSNVLAGKIYGIPVAGTMAHSYVQAHDTEAQAFRAFAQIFPGTVLLVDTYDTLEGVRRVIDLVRSDRLQVSAVRLDSGDLLTLSRESRRLLDAAGLQRIEIFASGGLDEHEIATLLDAEAPIDGFGVGTSMGVSTDVPALDIAYKLTEYAGAGRTKLSKDKPIFPGRTQVFRREQDGHAVDDVIARWHEEPEGRPLLRLVMRAGERTTDSEESLEVTRRRAAREIATLPRQLHALHRSGPAYPVTPSAALQQYHAEIRQKAREP